MMRRATVQRTQMHVRFRGLREALEKILHQLDLKIADALCRNLRIHDTIGPAAEIHRSRTHSFVHKHQDQSGAQNATLGAKGFLHGLSKSNPDVFNGVMLVHVEIAAGVQLQIDLTVSRNEFEHVVEESTSRAVARFSMPLTIPYPTHVPLFH